MLHLRGRVRSCFLFDAFLIFSFIVLALNINKNDQKHQERPKFNNNNKHLSTLSDPPPTPPRAYPRFQN